MLQAIFVQFHTPFGEHEQVLQPSPAGFTSPGLQAWLRHMSSSGVRAQPQNPSWQPQEVVGAL